MKRKLLSVLMALCLILTLLPTAVVCRGTHILRKNPENSRKSRSRSLRLLKRSQTIRRKSRREKRTFSPVTGIRNCPPVTERMKGIRRRRKTVYRTPPGRKSLKMAAPPVPNEVPLQEIILLEESAVTMEQNGGTTEYDSVSAAIDATQAYNKDTNKGLYTITLNENLAEDVVIPEGRYIKIAPERPHPDQ